jgi:methionyl-tRNA synthetase
MLQVSVNCFNCHKSLEDDKVLINNFPSVKTKAQCKHGEGYLYLSSTYGSFQTEAEMPLEEGEIIKLFCPHCDKTLVVDETCEVCGANMARVDLDVGGLIHFCTRKGCYTHHIEFADINGELRSFIEKYPALLVPFPREDENQEIE